MRLNERTRRRLPWLLFAAAIIITAVVYAQGLPGSWLFDDYPNIVDNHGVQPQDASVATLTRAALALPSSRFKRPMAALSFAFNYLASGLNPRWWKVTNIVIHLINGLLVFLLTRMLLALLTPRLPGEGDADHARRTGMIAALVTAAWLLLPINLTAVLYIVQRMESMANAFVLLGLVGYVAGRRRMWAGRRGLWLCIVSLIVPTAIGVTAKETAVMLPMYALLIEWIGFRFRTVAPAQAGAYGAASQLAAPSVDSRLRGNDGEGKRTRGNKGKRRREERAMAAARTKAGKRKNRASQARHRHATVSGPGPLTPALSPNGEAVGGEEVGGGAAARRSGMNQAVAGEGVSRWDWRVLVMFAVVLVLPMIIGLAWIVPHVLDPATWATREFTLGTRLLSEARIVVGYIGWTIVPLPHELSFYHDGYVVSQGILSPWTTLPSIMVIALLVAAVLWLRRRQPLIALGVALFLACHTLTGTILPLELVYEHRNYFASFGLMLVVVPFLAAPLRIWPMVLARSTLLGALFAWWIALTLMTSLAWSSQLGMAQELAARAPDSPRAQYELGRTYIIYSHYNPKSSFTPMVYAPLERAAKMPKGSILPQQALIFFNSRMHLPLKDKWWDSMIAKLKSRDPGVQDDSSLAALTQCALDKLCPLPKKRMVEAFNAALSHPNPSGTVLSAYAGYAWNILHEYSLGLRLSQRAVQSDPHEPAYHITLAQMAANLNQHELVKKQIEALEQLNYGGRLTKRIASLQALLTKPP